MLPLSLGFGILNAATTDILGGTITFAMTGHVGKVTQGMSDWLMNREKHHQKNLHSTTKLSASILTSFMMGAVAASWLTSSSSLNHITRKTPGSTLHTLWMGKNTNLPIFTIVGVLAVILI